MKMVISELFKVTFFSFFARHPTEYFVSACNIAVQTPKINYPSRKFP